ncbi:MAG: hypothetical protein CL605_03595 [Altibacter sp.]|nr:hypothetical protein [Altibacter sp.]|tara:strand:+ start:4262 stop:4879 length:618 start_codon:yes stop_codon:yes gene_type:complete
MVVIALRLCNYNLIRHLVGISASEGIEADFPLLEVIIMNEKNWIKNTSEVSLWLEKEDRGDNGKAIELSIMLGNNSNDDDMRSTYWTAIRSIGSVYADFPKARRGRESALPDEVEQNAISVKNAVYAAFAGISNQDVVLAAVLPHGRTGGAYADIDALATHYAKQAYNALVKGYKEGRWDGSMNGEIPTMTPPAVKSAEGGQEEE